MWTGFMLKISEQVYFYWNPQTSLTERKRQRLQYILQVCMFIRLSSVKQKLVSYQQLTQLY